MIEETCLKHCAHFQRDVNRVEFFAERIWVLEGTISVSFYPITPSLHLIGSLVVVQSKTISQPIGMSSIGEPSLYVQFSLRILFAVIFCKARTTENATFCITCTISHFFPDRNSCPESFVLRIRDASGSGLHLGEILGNRHPVPISGRTVPDERQKP